MTDRQAPWDPVGGRVFVVIFVYWFVFWSGFHCIVVLVGFELTT